MTATETLPVPSADEAAGLKLLSAKHRQGHPRAQVQTLRRIAVRALAKADWYEELRGNFERNLADPDFYEDGVTPLEAARYRREARAEVAHLIADQPPLREKARVAMEAAAYLNEVHGLGYPVRRAR